MGNSPSRQSHPTRTEEQSGQRSSGEESAHREEAQQDADAGKGRFNRNQNRKGERDQNSR